jgi:hypothetical protein
MNVRDVRETVSTMQRPEAPKSIEAATEADYAKASAVPTPPWMEEVARSDWKPAKAAPTAEADAKTEAASPSEE